MCVALVLVFGSVGSFRLLALVLVFGSVGSFRLLALVQVLVLCRCFCGVRRCLFSAWLSNNGINLTP